MLAKDRGTDRIAAKAKRQSQLITKEEERILDKESSILVQTLLNEENDKLEKLSKKEVITYRNNFINLMLARMGS